MVGIEIPWPTTGLPLRGEVISRSLVMCDGGIWVCGTGWGAIFGGGMGAAFGLGMRVDSAGTGYGNESCLAARLVR